MKTCTAILNALILALSSYAIANDACEVEQEPTP